MFQYPSYNATLGDDGSILLVWQHEDTGYFSAGKIDMDTAIFLKDADINPQTQIVTFQMNKSLFTIMEVKEK